MVSDQNIDLISLVTNDLKFDASKLLQEFERCSKIYRRMDYERYSITHSTWEDAGKSPAATRSCLGPQLKAYDENVDGPAVLESMKSWNANQIVTYFKGSYTEQVVKEIDAWLRQRGLRVTVAKFIAMHPGRCYIAHVDFPTNRYHVPVKTSEDVWFINGGKLCQMLELGKLYRLRSDVKHTALNASEEVRVHLIMDVCEA